MRVSTPFTTGCWQIGRIGDLARPSSKRCEPHGLSGFVVMGSSGHLDPGHGGIKSVVTGPWVTKFASMRADSMGIGNLCINIYTRRIPSSLLPYMISNSVRCAASKSGKN